MLYNVQRPEGPEVIQTSVDVNWLRSLYPECILNPNQTKVMEAKVLYKTQDNV